MDDFAYPGQPLNGHGSPMGSFQSGMTKRELFAAMAMQACRTRQSEYARWADLAADAVEIADALIAQLAKERT